MRTCLLALLSFAFLGAHAQQGVVSSSIYDFKVAAHNGSTIDLSQYRGKKILIVNTPVNASYNPQYAELEAFYKAHRDKVVVIGFLDDDFGPAPGDSKTKFTGNRDYKVSFPLAEKVYVKSDKMTPVYHWLTEKQYNNLKDSEVKWDFQKYLVDENGKLVEVFSPKVRVTDPKLLAAIGN